MLRALTLRYLLSERHVVGFIERLERSPELRDARGFGDALPSNSAFSRFFRLLSERADLPEQPIAGVVDELNERLPDMGREVAVDSTDIESCANPRRTRVRDPDAERGVLTRKIKTKGERKTEPFFGCKMRSPADEALGVPPIHEILPANKVDVNTLPALMETAGAAHDWFQPKYLMANKGCDSQANHMFVYERGTVPRPPAGCSLRPRNSWAAHYCPVPVQWENPEDNLRVIGVVPRRSEKWERLYRKRTAIDACSAA